MAPFLIHDQCNILKNCTLALTQTFSRVEGRHLPLLRVRARFMMMRICCTPDLILIRDPGAGNQIRNSNRLLHEAVFRFGGLQNLIYRTNIIYEKVTKNIVFFMN